MRILTWVLMPGHACPNGINIHKSFTGASVNHVDATLSWQGLRSGTIPHGTNFLVINIAKVASRTLVVPQASLLWIYWLEWLSIVDESVSNCNNG